MVGVGVRVGAVAVVEETVMAVAAVTEREATMVEAVGTVPLFVVF